jgi:serine protease AprX
MKYFFLSALLTGLFLNDATAQFTRYIVRLKDKNGTPYSLSNPISFLSQRSIHRRTRYSITIDSTDLPVNSSYINQIKNVPNVTVLNISKWLNAVTIQTSDVNAIATINGFSFVRSSSGIAAKMRSVTNIPGQENSKIDKNFSPPYNSNLRTEQVAANYYDYGTSSFNEIHLHNGEFLHNVGLRGQGMQIAMLDNGFNNYTLSSYHAFDSVNANHQVLGTWDFVAGEQDVSNDGNHGMSCFSTIAANIPGQFVGKAPKANFWLYQTEDNNSEQLIEEFNWACGAEKADSSGADILSSSLGYATFDSVIINSVKMANPNDHSYADMNGNTTIAVNAADLAAKKGMLVFIANGNSGNSPWHYLDTPADGDSVISVGAVNSNGVVGSFSSYGPSADGRIKPDVTSIGVAAVLQAAGGSIAMGNGTSFACPNMAGLATCLWQGFPEFDNMKIRSALWQAGSITNIPDDRIGYGIPDMKKAFVNLLLQFSSANGGINNCKVTLNWTSKDVSTMKYEIERKAFGETDFTKIADVAAQPNTDILTNHSYQKDDTLINVQAGTISYRIRQIVDSNAANFTDADIDTITINLANSCITTGIDPVNPNAGKIAIIPNPAQGQFTLRIETAYPISNLSIYILDIKGSTILRFNRSKPSGIANFDLPIHNLPKGKYIVTVYNGNELLASKKLIRL